MRATEIPASILRFVSHANRKATLDELVLNWFFVDIAVIGGGC